MLGIYSTFFGISILYLLIILVVYKEHVSAYYILLDLTIAMSCFGNMIIASATSLDVALAGNKVIYLGTSFVSLFMVQCLSDLCNVKVPKVINTIFCIAGMLVLAFVLSNGESGLYYKSCQLVQVEGGAKLIKEYGPAHMLFIVFLLALVVCGYIIVIYSFINNRYASVSSSILCLAILTITLGIYFAERALQANFEWDTLAYIIDFFLLLVQLKRVKLYDLAGFSAMTMENSNEYGFVVCDEKGRFAGGDGFARRTFTELNELRIDSMIKQVDTDFLAKLQGWMSGEEKDDLAYFKRNGKYIEARYSMLIEKNGQRIHCVRLHDDTKHLEYMNLIEGYNENLETEVNRQTKKLKRVQDDIIISMASIVENRDNNTGGHIKRTSDVVKVFVEHLMEVGYLEALTDQVAEHIIKAAPLHDFGKIAIADAVLNKPGKFTPEEYEEMKKHSEKGSIIVARILQHSEDIQFKNIAVNVAHYHHEKWNGTGYPEGLKEKEIPFEARVMALADVFDALVSKRVYKEQMDYDKAFSIIEESCGTHFDPNLCPLFLECRPQLEQLYDSYVD